ncbi:glycosyltransferase family 4 protein [Conexibacter sp. DBS9H8]|uniref:glycosyltransferase family 4 protein n=1 Tax=Conexibacter sp. DBS9H8 TaxID=2937801 RepID=UPI002010B4B4|nr:glycosyltransferase family 4 protein [Conexibacter sp. DBS9H8]
MHITGAAPTPPPGRLLGVNPVDHPGGAETTLLRLTRGLAGRGWRVTLTTPGGGLLADAALSAGLEWTPLPTGGLGRREGAGALRGYRALRRLAVDADVVYLNGAVCGRLLPALTGRRVVTVLDVNDMVGRVPGFWRRATLLLADTEAIARRLRELDPCLQPRVVGVPVDLDPPPAAAPWPSPSEPLIGFVGRLEPRKGVLDLLAALPLIRARRPVACVLIGDEPYGRAPAYAAAVRERAAALGVIDAGWQANAPGLMRHLDLLVLPSHAEPFGTVAAEAMAVGTPVVATAVDGLCEVVPDGVAGRLVPPGDPGAIATAVLEVLDARPRMAAAAAAHAIRWGTPAYVEGIDTLLRETVAERARARGRWT